MAEGIKTSYRPLLAAWLIYCVTHACGLGVGEWGREWVNTIPSPITPTPPSLSPVVATRQGVIDCVLEVLYPRPGLLETEAITPPRAP